MHVVPVLQAVQPGVAVDRVGVVEIEDEAAVGGLVYSRFA